MNLIAKLLANKLVKSGSIWEMHALQNEAIKSILKKISNLRSNNRFFRIIRLYVENLDQITYESLRQTLCKELFYFVF